MSDHRATIAALGLFEKAALLSGANVWQTRAIPRLGIPALWMSDGPHGLRMQPGNADHLGLGESDPAVCYPTAATVAGSWDEELATELGEALGRDAAARDVHVLLGPGLNIKRSPLGGRNFEYFSEDPELSGRLAAAYVRGIQSRGVAATPKHFAANSQELRRLVSDSVLDERTLRELYLTAFEIVVREARPWALMTAYNLVNGAYAHENPHLLTDILRDEWGFDGVVVSDWGGADDPVASVAAGGTIEMPSPGFDSARQIVAAVEDRTLDESLVDARVAELLTLVERVSARPRATPSVSDEESGHVLGRRAAAAGAVLLRNEDGLLPLAAGTRVGLIGAFAEHPRYQGAGSSIVNPTRLTTLRGAIAATPLTLAGFATGFRSDGTTDARLLADAAAVARDADVVVLALGLPAADESEGLDRRSLGLPEVQLRTLDAVAATGTPIVAVLAGGGAIELPWAPRTAAVLHTFLGGQAGAEAAWDILSGAVEPGGRLAESFPVQLADDPTAGSFPSDHRTAEYREGLFARYRHHTTAGVPAAYPFGFGLGYTTFALSDLEVDASGARVTVANTGARAGAEVVQLYVRRASPTGIPRPALELKAFEKVRLEPGESTRVMLPFGQRTFRFWDERTSAWQVEAGDYEILVGRSSVDLTLVATLAVEGTVPVRESDPALDPYLRGDVRSVPDDAFRALLGREIPDAGWHAPPFSYNSPLDQVRRSPSRLVRFAFGFLERAKSEADAKHHPDVETLFVYYAPFRSLNKMTGGAVTRRATEAVIAVADGRVVRGLVRLARALVSGRRQERGSRERFARDAGAAEPVRSARAED